MTRKSMTLAIAALSLGLLFGAQTVQASSEAHSHIGHVMTAWGDTPDGAGLLPTAQGEAEIAVAHAGYAASKPDDLANMQLHTVHVVNAIDPSVEPKGPGMGYGVKQAAQGTADHIGFAAAAGDASDAVKTHAVHVATSAGNVVAWSDEIVLLGKQVKGAASSDQAAPAVARILVLSQAIASGQDADGDGQPTWKKGEGGLAQAEKHMGFMLKAEGL